MSPSPPNAELSERERAQPTQHTDRLTLIAHWNIRPGARVLELGCGQGDCTEALAITVGETGHVTGVDPASLDYGSPSTLGEAQAHLSKGPLGSRITWIQADPLAFLSTQSFKYDAAVLAHSPWYFSSPSLLRSTLSALHGHVECLHIAEWALSSRDQEGVPHVLAALAQAALECHKPASESNIRTVLSPAQLTALARDVGWVLADSTQMRAPEGMGDGGWEVSAVLRDGFWNDVEQTIEGERERTVVRAMIDAVRASKEGLPVGSDIRAMDVWVATFHPAPP